MQPRLIEGGLVVDERGLTSFVNAFDLASIRRFYVVSNHAQGTVRAWHGHQKEAKYVVALKGSALVAAVQLDDWERPSQSAEMHKFVLSEHKMAALFIPSGFANGFMSLTPDTQLMWFSTTTLEDSAADDFRYPSDYWDIWKVGER
jgi:dTDP-4-dehydrorhamnose 3,5-epimerase-like enzyme